MTTSTPTTESTSYFYIVFEELSKTKARRYQGTDIDKALETYNKLHDKKMCRGCSFEEDGKVQLTYHNPAYPTYGGKRYY